MIEHTAQGPNVRFFVTNRRGRAADVFAWYHQRGQAENFIKELKRDLAADRLSCHAFRANAFRLLLHALAYDLLHLFRLRTLAGTPLATATLGTVRLRLLKLGARVVRSVGRWWFHLATGWPAAALRARATAPRRPPRLSLSAHSHRPTPRTALGILAATPISVRRSP
jgi:hypothetical protein